MINTHLSALMSNMLRSPKVYMESCLSPRSNKKSQDERTATLLDHQFGVVVPLVVVLFILFMVAIGLDKKNSTTPVCDSGVELKHWVNGAMAIAAGCAILTCTQHIIRVFSLATAKSKMSNTSLIKLNVILFVLSAISGTSKLATLFWHFGGVCEDAFGVYSPAAQWVEWIVLVPLLNYIACAVEQKTQMDSFDAMIVSLLALMILCGFLLIVRGPVAMHIFFMVLSFLCLLVVTVMTVSNYFVVFASSAGKVRMSNYFSTKQTHRKATLLMQVLVIRWYYLIVWILGAVRAFDANYTYAAYMIGSIFGKAIFASLVMESHETLLYGFLIMSANGAKLGDDDHSVDTSVSPLFPREKKQPTSFSISAAILRAMAGKIVPVAANDDSAEHADVRDYSGAEAEAGMSTIQEEEADGAEEVQV